jgi:methionyl-tRNA formyltransferase
MNLLFVIPKDTLYAPLYIERILSCMKNNITCEPVAVCCVNPLHNSSVRNQLLKRLRIYGFKQFFCFLVLVIKTKVFSLMENIISFKRSYNIAKLCKNFTIPYIELDSVNSDYFHTILIEKKVDIFISIGVGQKYSADTLKIAPYSLNVHSSLIPKYRGLMGLFWAHFYDENTAGVTIHRMVEKFDAGGILGQCTFPISKNDTVHRLYLKAIEHGSRMISEVIEKIDQHMEEERIPDTSNSKYYTHPTEHESKQFRAKGKHFFTFKDIWDLHL